MSIELKQKNSIKVKQYVTNKKGHKIAAILDMSEFIRIENMLEDLLDLKAIEDRKNEEEEDYEIYSRKRKSTPHV